LEKDKLWKAVLGEMELSLPPMMFATWFKGTELDSINDGKVFIRAQNIFSRDWLKSKHSGQILESLQKFNSSIKEINFFVGDTRKKDRGKINLESKPVSRSRESVQLQTYNLKEDYTFDSFVVGNNNSLAFAVAKEVAKSPGKKHNPLFLYGGVGLGKTHLAQAIGNEIKKNSPKAKINYVSCETFTNDYIAAIAAKKMNQFKKKYREVDVLIVDDIQFLSNKEGSQEEFFHTFNSLHQNKRHIILTADKVPQAIPALADRLASRFGGGTIADLLPPNLETRIAILNKKCQEIEFYPEAEVVEFIADQIKSNVRELEGALNRVYNYCHFNNISASKDTAKKALQDIISSSSKALSSAQIIQAVCDYYKLDKKDLLGKSRKQELIEPRHVAIYLLRNNTSDSLPLIGKIMGGKDHSTILHSYRKIEKGVLINIDLKKDIENICELLKI